MNFVIIEKDIIKAVNKLNRKRKIILNSALSTIVLLFAIRIIFFLKDTANKSVEQFLIVLIFISSIVFLLAIYAMNKEKVHRLFFTYLDKVIIVSFIMIVEFLFALWNQTGFNYTLLFAPLTIGLLYVGFSLVVSTKVSKIVDIAFLVFYTIYAFSQDVYHRIFSDMYSFVEFATIQEGVESSENMYQFSSFHIVLLILLVGTILAYRQCDTSHITISKQNVKKGATGFFLIFLLLNLNAVYPVKSARLHLSDHYLYQSVYSKKRFVSKFGNVNLLFRDVFDLITPSFSTKKDYDYIEDYFDTLEYQHVDNDYSGMFEGKNLIFIAGESFDLLSVNETLTPNIWKLKTEGWDYTNYYTPVFPRTTCDSEITFNTSLIPSIEDGPTCYVYNSNSYEYSLANMFNKEQYTTNALHSNYKEFYTRDNVYEGLGYDHFYGQHEIGLSDTDKRYDQVFVDETADLVFDDVPFFNFYLTLSGHSPYTESHLVVQKNLDKVDAYYGNTIPESVKMFIATQIELDDMVGSLLVLLEEKGLLEDTVIILTNDHYPYTLNHDDYEAYTGITKEYQKNKSPLYIWTPTIEHQEIDTLGSSLDILPTIVNLFGLGDTYEHYIGYDMFATDYERIVYFKDYTILTESGYYELSSEEIPLDIFTIADERYRLSSKILKVDYYKNNE